MTKKWGDMAYTSPVSPTKLRPCSGLAVKDHTFDGRASYVGYFLKRFRFRFRVNV